MFTGHLRWPRVSERRGSENLGQRICLLLYYHYFDFYVTILSILIYYTCMNTFLVLLLLLLSGSQWLVKFCFSSKFTMWHIYKSNTKRFQYRVHTILLYYFTFVIPIPNLYLIILQFCFIMDENFTIHDVKFRGLGVNGSSPVLYTP